MVPQHRLPAINVAYINLDDWGAQVSAFLRVFPAEPGGLSPPIILVPTTNSFRASPLAGTTPTLLSNLGLLGLCSDFWIGMDITTSEWETEASCVNEYAKDSDWPKAFIWAGNNSLYYCYRIGDFQMPGFIINSNYQEIPPFKENNSTVTSSSGDANGYDQLILNQMGTVVTIPHHNLPLFWMDRLFLLQVTIRLN